MDLRNTIRTIGRSGPVGFGWCFRMRAAIIGVSVSETNAEKMMVTASVTANSRNRRPDDIRHEQQRNQHGDERDRQRHDR